MSSPMSLVLVFCVLAIVSGPSRVAFASRTAAYPESGLEYHQLPPQQAQHMSVWDVASVFETSLPPRGKNAAGHEEPPRLRRRAPPPLEESVEQNDEHYDEQGERVPSQEIFKSTHHYAGLSLLSPSVQRLTTPLDGGGSGADVLKMDKGLLLQLQNPGSITVVGEDGVDDHGREDFSRNKASSKDEATEQALYPQGGSASGKCSAGSAGVDASEPPVSVVAAKDVIMEQIAAPIPMMNDPDEVSSSSAASAPYLVLKLLQIAEKQEDFEELRNYLKAAMANRGADEADSDPVSLLRAKMSARLSGVMLESCSPSESSASRSQRGEQHCSAWSISVSTGGAGNLVPTHLLRDEEDGCGTTSGLRLMWRRIRDHWRNRRFQFPRFSSGVSEVSDMTGFHRPLLEQAQHAHVAGLASSSAAAAVLREEIADSGGSGSGARATSASLSSPVNSLMRSILSEVRREKARGKCVRVFALLDYVPGGSVGKFLVGQALVMDRPGFRRLPAASAAVLSAVSASLADTLRARLQGSRSLIHYAPRRTAFLSPDYVVSKARSRVEKVISSSYLAAAASRSSASLAPFFRDLKRAVALMESLIAVYGEDLLFPTRVSPAAHSDATLGNMLLEFLRRAEDDGTGAQEIQITWNDNSATAVDLPLETELAKAFFGCAHTILLDTKSEDPALFEEVVPCAGGTTGGIEVDEDERRELIAILPGERRRASERVCRGCGRKEDTRVVTPPVSFDFGTAEVERNRRHDVDTGQQRLGAAAIPELSRARSAPSVVEEQDSTTFPMSRVARRLRARSSTSTSFLVRKESVPEDAELLPVSSGGGFVRYSSEASCSSSGQQENMSADHANGVSPGDSQHDPAAQVAASLSLSPYSIEVKEPPGLEAITLASGFLLTTPHTALPRPTLPRCKDSSCSLASTRATERSDSRLSISSISEQQSVSAGSVEDDQTADLPLLDAAGRVGVRIGIDNPDAGAEEEEGASCSSGPPYTSTPRPASFRGVKRQESSSSSGSENCSLSASSAIHLAAAAPGLAGEGEEDSLITARGHAILFRSVVDAFETTTLVQFAGKAKALYPFAKLWRAEIEAGVRSRLLACDESKPSPGHQEQMMESCTSFDEAELRAILLRAHFAAVFQRIADAAYALERNLESSTTRLVVNLLFFCAEAPELLQKLQREAAAVRQKKLQPFEEVVTAPQRDAVADGEESASDGGGEAVEEASRAEARTRTPAAVVEGVAGVSLLAKRLGAMAIE